MYTSVAALPVCSQQLHVYSEVKGFVWPDDMFEVSGVWNSTGTAACLADVTLLISGFIDLEKANLHLNGVHPVTVLWAQVSLQCHPR